MEIPEFLAYLLNNEEYHKWQQTNPSFYLANVLGMSENPEEWQIGFYSTEKGKMVMFRIFSGNIQNTLEQDVLKSPIPITMLHKDEIIVSLTEALQKAKDLLPEFKISQDERYLWVVQQGEQHAVFNISFFTVNLRVAAFAIDAQSGEILKKGVEILGQLR